VARVDRGSGRRRYRTGTLTHQLDAVFREHWWGAVATVTRLVGDLGLAEDGVQDACVAAVEQWADTGVPANPRAWLIAVARRRATDRMRRESARGGKEAQAMWHLANRPVSQPDDELALIYLCCHPALDPAARIALTLRAVCGLATREIAAAFLVPEATMAKRLTRAKHKIRDAGIPFRVPPPDLLVARTADVMRVVYLIFTEGHMATAGPALVRAPLCDQAIRLARGLHDRLPDEPEAAGLLALLLLTDARRATRTDDAGDLVLLEDQDRSRWDRAQIDEGERILDAALRAGRPGAYQLWAAIAACHATAPDAAGTDWRQISLLYRELLRYEPTPVVEANRAVAVAMADGPAAGLAILDELADDTQLRRWPHLHVARGDLLGRLGRTGEAAAAYRRALDLSPPPVERAFVERQIRGLTD
jgi:RNA polymerase sigma-70 factor (ECF subfamily)